MLGVTTIVTVIACVLALPSDLETTNLQATSFRRYDTEGRIASDGYYAESHDIVTKDGYILEINRISNGRYNMKSSPLGSKPVVFLMHGLQSSALSYILAGPGVSIAYILADAGYDVWMGNARGSINSRRHVTLNPDDKNDKKNFFDYTYEEVAIIDLPAMLDYVLGVTNKKQLNYIGHSQGGTAFLVLTSMMPEYNEKFTSVNLLAAVGYQNYFPTPLLSLSAISTDIIYAFALRVGFIELLGPNSDDDINCTEEETTGCMLDSILGAVNGTFGTFEVVAGASIKQYGHYGQNIRDRKFRRWNYGPVQNLIKYGALIPPSYDLGLISAELTMYYTVGDILLHEKDVLNMANDIPNAKVYKVARDDFSHTDFLNVEDSKELVTDHILENLNKINKQ